MDNHNKVVSYANELEYMLREFLECDYDEFGVKANDNLICDDWQSPINFALGFRYALSNKDPKVKENIDYFLGNELYGESIGDVVEQYEFYGFESQEEAYRYIDATLKDLRNILFGNELKQ